MRFPCSVLLYSLNEDAGQMSHYKRLSTVHVIEDCGCGLANQFGPKILALVNGQNQMLALLTS